MPRFPLLVALAAITLGSTSAGSSVCDALARCVCSWRRLATPAEQIAVQRELAAAVLAGRVVAVERDSARGGRTWRHAGDTSQMRQRLVARVAAQRWWKGDATDTVTIVLRRDLRHGTSCDMMLRADSSYLLFAHRDGDELTATSCGGTRLLSSADSVLPLLGAPIRDER